MTTEEEFHGYPAHGSLRAPASTGFETGIVHCLSRKGHRGGYLDLCSLRFGLSPRTGKPNFLELVRCTRLLLATLDDAIWAYIPIILARCLLGRRTAALFVRPQSCFTPVGLRTVAKRALFVALRGLRNFNTVTITPFAIAPKYRKIATYGSYDPEYWDLEGSTVESSEILDAVREEAGDRRLVVYLGTLNSNKGFPFFVRCASDQALAAKFCFVAAGELDPKVRDYTGKFVSNGGVLVAKELSDKEFKSLLRFADLLWACYDPHYDQASGIFGRATQLGLRTLVRRNSLIAQFGTTVQSALTEIDFDVVPSVEVLHAALMREPPPAESRLEIAARLRAHFYLTLAEALNVGQSL